MKFPISASIISRTFETEFAIAGIVSDNPIASMLARTNSSPDTWTRTRTIVLSSTDVPPRRSADTCSAPQMTARDRVGNRSVARETGPVSGQRWLGSTLLTRNTSTARHDRRVLRLMGGASGHGRRSGCRTSGRNHQYSGWRHVDEGDFDG